MKMRIHHVSWLVQDTAKAIAFYVDLLGLRPDPTRPDLGFPGAWLWINDSQQVHLLEVPNPDPRGGRPDHGGRDRHVALQVDDLAVIRRRLDAAAVDYTLSRSGRQALFCRDPDGNTLELIQTLAGENQ